jgi:nitroimidazol reductase NimA-like FMN-containing flavoprotein (pyridoxamine 5'-phosphate oxidase superfamily)
MDDLKHAGRTPAGRAGRSELLTKPAAADHHGLRVLDEETCFDLLGGVSIGRLGFSADALPVIFPVNFAMDGRTIVILSEAGQKVTAARKGSVACFEVDWFDPFSHIGWSVLATGRLGLVDPERVAEVQRLPLAPWALERPECFVELPVEVVSGRRLGRV